MFMENKKIKPVDVGANSAQWNACKLQGFFISTVDPSLNHTLVFDGANWSSTDINLENIAYTNQANTFGKLQQINSQGTNRCLTLRSTPTLGGGGEDNENLLQVENNADEVLAAITNEGNVYGITGSIGDVGLESGEVIASTFTGGTGSFIAPTSSTVPLTTKGTTSQSANLLEAKNSSNTVVASISPSGVVTGVGSGLTTLNASNVSSGTLGDGRLSSNIPLKDGNPVFQTTVNTSSSIVVKAKTGQTDAHKSFEVQAADGTPVLFTRGDSWTYAAQFYCGFFAAQNIGSFSWWTGDQVILSIINNNSSPTEDTFACYNFAAQKVFAVHNNYTTIRKSGGTANVDEIRISHDGTGVVFKNMNSNTPSSAYFSFVSANDTLSNISCGDVSATTFTGGTGTLATSTAGTTVLQLQHNHSTPTVDTFIVNNNSSQKVFGINKSYTRIRQSGGTTDVDEVRISHDGTLADFRNMNSNSSSFSFTSANATIAEIIANTNHGVFEDSSDTTHSCTTTHNVILLTAGSMGRTLNMETAQNGHWKEIHNRSGVVWTIYDHVDDKSVVDLEAGTRCIIRFYDARWMLVGLFIS